MPRKEKEYNKNINVRISERQCDRWSVYAKNNRFASLSALIRFAVEELIEGNFSNNSPYPSNLVDKIEELNEKYKEILSLYDNLRREIVRNDTSSQDERLKIWQKETILNLIRDSPRREDEIQRLLPDLSEIEVLRILNELIETSLINLEDNVYRYQEVV